jgi:hypothetical protein
VKILSLPNVLSQGQRFLKGEGAELFLHPGHFVLWFFGDCLVIVLVDEACLGLSLRAVVGEMSQLVALEAQLILLQLMWLSLDGSPFG